MKLIDLSEEFESDCFINPDEVAAIYSDLKGCYLQLRGSAHPLEFGVINSACELKEIIEQKERLLPSGSDNEADCENCELYRAAKA